MKLFFDMGVLVLDHGKAVAAAGKAVFFLQGSLFVDLGKAVQ